MVTVLDQTEAGVQNRKFEGGDPDFNVPDPTRREFVLWPGVLHAICTTSYCGKKGPYCNGDTELRGDSARAWERGALISANILENISNYS